MAAALESSPQDELERAIQVFLARQQEEEEENAEQDKSAQRGTMEDPGCVVLRNSCWACVHLWPRRQRGSQSPKHFTSPRHMVGKAALILSQILPVQKWQPRPDVEGAL